MGHIVIGLYYHLKVCQKNPSDTSRPQGKIYKCHGSIALSSSLPGKCRQFNQQTRPILDYPLMYLILFFFFFFFLGKWLTLIFFNFYFIPMCIQCLGHFSPLSPTPYLCPLTPLYQAETVLPLSLILLKREYKQ
jgi:hypothetical protein